MAEECHSEMPSVRFAKVDVSENPRVGRRLKLKGVPTVVYYKEGKAIDFRGRLKKEWL